MPVQSGSIASSAEPVVVDGVPEFLNRELSWLAFNDRVLHEAVDERTPLLERVRFLGIFTSNLDEFFMKRVGGLKRQVLAGVVPHADDGMTPAQQISAIRAAVEPMLALQARCFNEQIRPALATHVIRLLPWSELTAAERSFAQQHFRNNLFPVLTPMAVDPGHPFPFLSNLSLSLGVRLSLPDSDEHLFARVKVPETLPIWLRLETREFPGEYRFVSVVDLISHSLGALFPGMELISVTPFRVTRNADVERDEEDAEDLLELIVQELRERRFAQIVRLEHGPKADPWTISFLIRELELSELDVYELPGELDYTDLKPIADLPIKALKYEAWAPVISPRLADDEADIFSVIRAGDLLVHHPYESFSDSVERFVRTAADDPKVLAIKLTLYRIGDSRSLMDSLIRAAEAGKQVVCMVELKARFDEQRNIFWAQQLEKAGTHVFYGMVGLKTHTKLAMVVRQETDSLRTYVHIGTGNYNGQTARIYTDLGLFTCNPKITDEVVELFHYLTGRSLKNDYQALLVAPINMRQRFLELINREVEHHKAGRPAGIIAKMNSLEDKAIIRALYTASQTGVRVSLVVRGFCCLRPGVIGLSDNIRVISVVGRFLEHSRVFYFRNGGQNPVDGCFLIGSADWMPRNLKHRVEIVTPIEDFAIKQRLWQILELLQNDTRQAWDMHPDGTYVQRQPTTPERELGTHAELMRLTNSTDSSD
ncbi:MAG TPA: polyphosphate kinase 1 [Phycisphaerae bacterium]|nr:polyphosphate kinase 1 [Phycisphaerae bacterium]